MKGKNVSMENVDMTNIKLNFFFFFVLSPLKDKRIRDGVRA